MLGHACAGAAVAIDAADVALFTNDLRCLPHIILFGKNAKRKILLNICLSVLTKVSGQTLTACMLFSTSCQLLACDMGFRSLLICLKSWWQ